MYPLSLPFSPPSLSTSSLLTDIVTNILTDIVGLGAFFLAFSTIASWEEVFK
jgi:hypothetical protein